MTSETTTPDRYAGLWRTSSRSGHTGQCVEVALAATAVGVRDTKDRTGGTLTFSPGAWAAFTAGLKRA